MLKLNRFCLPRYHTPRIGVGKSAKWHRIHHTIPENFKLRSKKHIFVEILLLDEYPQLFDSGK